MIKIQKYKNKKAVNPDVVLLQEVDIGTERTSMIDVGNEIANALRMQIVYGADCWHINDVHENDENENAELIPSWNSRPHRGCEGNAILTAFDILRAYPVIMPCVRNRYRPQHRHRKRHTAVAAVLCAPEIGEFVCYSLHMDAFSGRVARSTEQYGAIYADIMEHHIDGEGDKKRRSVVVGGDFNSHNHGIARCLNQLTGGDPLRFRFLGMAESEWWQRFVIGKELTLLSNGIPSSLVHLKDPFHKTKDVTASKKFAGITVWSGKIDWLLYDVERLSVQNKFVSDTDASDHQYLLCDFKANR